MISSSILVALFLALLLPGTDAHHNVFTIENNCPAPIKIFINGKSQGFVEPKKSIVKSYPEKWSGFIYTSSNGGTATGSGTTRAGFFGAPGLYYILKDRDGFNTGVSITARDEGNDKICSKTVCNNPQCTSAFSTIPGRLTSLELSSKTTPLCSAIGVTPARLAAKVAAITSSLNLTSIASDPDSTPGSRLSSLAKIISGLVSSVKDLAHGRFAAATGDHTRYTVQFCPSGNFPAPKGSVQIHPNNHADKCIDVRGAVFENGTPVQIYDCNKTRAQRWIINPDESSQIKVAGTSFCLDAGKVHESRIPLKIWTCRKDNPNQQWVYTQNNTIILVGTDLAVDLTEGSLKNRNKIQLYKAYHGLNQVWTTSQC